MEGGYGGGDPESDSRRRKKGRAKRKKCNSGLQCFPYIMIGRVLGQEKLDTTRQYFMFRISSKTQNL